MNELTWAQGLILWIVAGGFVAWLFGAIAQRGRGEEWDETAARKRRIARRAKLLSGEFK